VKSFIFLAVVQMYLIAIGFAYLLPQLRIAPHPSWGEKEFSGVRRF
jgi:hypothetical protein